MTHHLSLSLSLSRSLSLSLALSLSPPPPPLSYTQALQSLLVFPSISPPPLQVNVPNKNDKDVYYYPPGVWNIKANFQVPSHKTVYIAGGAFVQGGFGSAKNSNNITIRGRGVVSGELMTHPAEATDNLALANLCGDGITIEGITGVDAPTYNFQVQYSTHSTHYAHTLHTLCSYTTHTMLIHYRSMRSGARHVARQGRAAVLPCRT
jgi:hypothetical protein